uniref:MSH1 n=1 Tax=Arundo donax TaxID=35708 RepID=A0A0A9CQR9_ARUDO
MPQQLHQHSQTLLQHGSFSHAPSKMTPYHKRTPWEYIQMKLLPGHFQHLKKSLQIYVVK